MFFARIHDAVPGFAGLTFEDGVPTIYMVQGGQAQFAQLVLAPFLAARGKAGRGVRIRQARFAWGELYEWRLKARALFDLPELRSLGISTSSNRLVVGLALGSSPDAARERLAALGVDLDAVVFRDEPEIQLFSDLDDRSRPVMGGQKISYTDVGSQYCTMGANVLWDTLRTFLTAAHCAPGSVYLFQPTYGSPNKIGEVLLRSPAHTCTPDNQTQVNNCRHSDAALVQYDDSASWSFGHIAKPFFSGQGSGSTGINGRFWITDSYYLAVQDDTVQKLGVTTGWTYGPINWTCLDRYSPESNYWYICQVEVASGAGGGDSGGPVFKLGTYGRVNLAGILWGGHPDSVYFYSPLRNIEDDLGGYIDVITDSPSLPSGVSISGPTSIRPGASCLWEGSASGGTTPFSYTWENDTHLVSYTDSYEGGMLAGGSGSSFVLKFTVTNDAGFAYDQITVTEDSNAPICAY